MSNFSTFSPLAGGTPGTAPDVFVASTPDTLAQITTSGYLNDKAGKVKNNDIIFINYLDTSVFPLGETALFGEFQVAVSGSTISLNAFSSGSSPGSSFFASVPITAAQFNGMYAAPMLLVAAPGANKVLQLGSMNLVMTYNSVAYTAGGVTAVQYDSTVNGAGVIASTTHAAADFFATASTLFQFNAGVVVEPLSTTVNKGLYLSNITQAFATGNSAFVANITYKIIPTV